MSTFSVSSGDKLVALKNPLAIGVKELILFTILAIYWVNFRGYGIFIPFVLLPFAISYFMRNKITKTQFFLLFFCVVHATILYMYGYTSKALVLNYLLYPLCFYTIGFNFVKKDINFKKTYRLLTVMIVTFTLFALLCLLKTLAIYGNVLVASVALNGRGVTDLWTGKLIGATGLNMYLSFALSSLSVIFLFDKRHKNKMFKFIGILCFAASVYSVMLLGSRTGMMIIAAAVVAIFLFAGKLNSKKIIQLFMIVVFLLLVKFGYDQDFLGMRMTWENSLLYSRFYSMDMTQDPRLAAWQAAFNGMFVNPLGGKQTELPCCVAYAHNMWLDVALNAGVIPFVLLVVFTIAALISLISFVRKDFPILLKGIMIGFFTAFFITFFMEPVMEDYLSYYFNTFCMVVGVIQSSNINFKTERKVISEATI